jgi:hypothetical protein
VQKLKPIICDAVRMVDIGTGDWVLWHGSFYLSLGWGWLAGPVGSADVRLPEDALVQRVTMTVI